MHQMHRVRLLAILAALILLLSPATAWAHAQLLGTSPASDAVLADQPSTLELAFNEPVSPLTVKLINSVGATVDLLAQTVGGETVRVSLPEGLGQGTHVLSYRVVSADGHPIGGALIFSIGAKSSAPTIAAVDAGAAMVLWGAKALLFICLFVGVGGAAFQAMSVLPTRAQTASLAASVLGVVLAAATVGLQGVDALALPLASITDNAAWAAGASTSYGLTAAAAGASFVIAMLALTTTRRPIPAALGALAALVGALSLSLSGHASAASPQWITRPAVFLHIGSLIVWLGALYPLWLLLRDANPSAVAALARFSRTIPFAIAPLLASGVALAAIQLGAPGSQWATGYGFILAAKLGLVAVLFGLALWNRRSLTAPAFAGKADAQRKLRRSIAAEMVIVILILSLAAGWRFTPPPRALAENPASATQTLQLDLTADKTNARVTISPGHAGPVTVTLDLTNPAGEPRPAQSVVLQVSSPELGIEPIKYDLSGEASHWTAEGITLPVAGRWTIGLAIRISRFDLAQLEGTLELP